MAVGPNDREKKNKPKQKVNIIPTGMAMMFSVRGRS